MSNAHAGGPIVWSTLGKEADGDRDHGLIASDPAAF
jgi:hypothetical protein